MDPLIITSTGIETPQSQHVGAIARISPQEIAWKEADHPAQILNIIPGLFINRGSGQEHLSAMRSPVLTGNAGAGSFLVAQDGIPLRAAPFANVNALMEAMPEMSGGIEVVRGPTSALYGANALHGLVNILSRPPAPEKDFDAHFRAGPHNLYHGAFSMSRSFERARFHYGQRLSFAFGHDGGFRESSGYDHLKLRARADIRAQKTSMRVLLSAYDLEQETAAYVLGQNAYKSGVLRESNPSPDAARDAQAIRMQLPIEHRLSPRQTLFFTPYMRFNAMRFLMHFICGTPTERNSHWSLGARARYHKNFAAGHQIIFGGDMEWSEGVLKEIQSGSCDAPFGASLPAGVHYDYEVDAFSSAFFFQSLWRLLPKLFLQTGLRGDFTLYDYKNRTESGDFGRFRRPQKREDDFFALTPKAGLIYEATPATFFLNYARGQRPPQAAELYRLQTMQNVGAGKIETLDSVELGGRTLMTGLQLEAVFYYMQKRNLILRDADGFNVTDGRTEHLGVELDAKIQLSSSFRLRLGASWARHLYDFERPVTREAEAIRKGDDIDSAPRWLVNAEAIYQTQKWRAALEWVHVGRYYTNAANSQTYPGHHLLHLRLAYSPDSRQSYFLNILNLTNKKYAERADFAFGNARYFPGEELTLHGGFMLRF